jgi:hypothetical protein
MYATYPSISLLSFCLSATRIVKITLGGTLMGINAEAEIAFN